MAISEKIKKIKARARLRLNEVRRDASAISWATLCYVHRANHISNHINMTDQELIDRLLDEDITGSSSFYGDKDEVALIIRDTLLDEEYESPLQIAEWLEDYSSDDEIVMLKTYNYPIGKTFLRSQNHDWSKGAMDCYTAVVVLQKISRKEDFGWRVKTAYPEP